MSWHGEAGLHSTPSTREDQVLFSFTTSLKSAQATGHSVSKLEPNPTKTNKWNKKTRNAY